MKKTPLERQYFIILPTTKSGSVLERYKYNYAIDLNYCNIFMNFFLFFCEQNPKFMIIHKKSFILKYFTPSNW